MAGHLLRGFGEYNYPWVEPGGYCISLGGSISRKRGERAPLLGQETDGLDAMVHDVDGGESEPEVSGTDEE